MVYITGLYGLLVFISFFMVYNMVSFMSIQPKQKLYRENKREDWVGLGGSDSGSRQFLHIVVVSVAD